MVENDKMSGKRVIVIVLIVVICLLPLAYILINYFTTTIVELPGFGVTREYNGLEVNVSIRAHQAEGIFFKRAEPAYSCWISRIIDNSCREFYHISYSSNSYKQGSMPSGDIGRINETSVYFYVGRAYGLTQDKGENWTFWEADKDLLGDKGSNFGFIQSVRVEENGVGVMILDALELTTENFGETWSLKQ